MDLASEINLMMMMMMIMISAYARFSFVTALELVTVKITTRGQWSLAIMIPTEIIAAAANVLYACLQNGGLRPIST